MPPLATLHPLVAKLPQPLLDCVGLYSTTANRQLFDIVRFSAENLSYDTQTDKRVGEACLEPV